MTQAHPPPLDGSEAIGDLVLGFVSGASAGEGLGTVRAVRKGLPLDVVEEVIRAGRLTPVELDRLRIPTDRQAASNGKLTPEQSDRLVRVLRVMRQAEETFANPEKARTWLRRQTNALGGQSPLELLDTDVGARNVEALLGRIGHGIAA